MSKYAPLATSNASQFVDILLRGLAGTASRYQYVSATLQCPR